MIVHRLLVERVHLRRLGGSAGGNDILADNFDWCQVASGEKEIGPLSRKGACDSAADRAPGSVYHRNLVLQHHLWFLSVPWWCHTRHLRSRDRRPKLICAWLLSLSADVRIVRAVHDADTTTSGKWPPSNRPVRPSAGVCTGWSATRCGERCE